MLYISTIFLKVENVTIKTRLQVVRMYYCIYVCLLVRDKLSCIQHLITQIL